MKLLVFTIIAVVTALGITTFIAVFLDKKGKMIKLKGGAYQYEKTKKAYKFIPLSFVCALFLLGGLFISIPANSVGIIYDEIHGGVQERTYTEGFHTKSIFEHITTISTANRSAIVNTTGQTNDGQYATFQLSIIYKIEKQDAGKFFKVTNNDDIPNAALNTIVKSCLQSSTIKYDIFELLSTELENARLDFKDDLAKELYCNYFVTIVDVAFDDIDGGKEVEDILQAAAKAQQEIEIAKLDAQAQLITANNEAEVKKVLADAQAYAIKMEGEAEGDAASIYVEKVEAMINNLYENMQSSLTYKECADMVLSIVFYDTWDGKLPEVLTSDDLSSMIGALVSNKQ